MVGRTAKSPGSTPSTADKLEEKRQSRCAKYQQCRCRRGLNGENRFIILLLVLNILKTSPMKELSTESEVPLVEIKKKKTTKFTL